MLAVAAVVIVVATVSRASYLPLPFDGDGAMFAYMGKLTAEGGRFGVDLIDNKLPTVGLVTSPFWIAFGTWWPGYVLTQLVLALVAATLVARQAGISFGPHARMPAFLVGVALFNLNSAVMAGFQLETLQAFFACLAAACGMAAITRGDRRDAFACGLAGGMAALVKPTGGGVIAAMMMAMTISAVVKSRNLKDSLALGASVFAGVSVPVAGALAYLVVSDQLRLIPTLLAQIGEYASSSSFAAEDLFRPLSILTLFVTALLIRGWVYRRRAVEVTAPQQAALWTFAVGWLAIELTGILFQRRMYGYHFLPLAAPAALVFGALPRHATVGQMAGVLALPVIFSIWGAAEVREAAASRNDNTPAVARWLDQHTLPGERVWRDITPQVLIGTDLRSASRMQLTFLFMNSDDSPQTFASMLLDDLTRHRPRYIVLPTNIDAHVAFQSGRVRELSRIPARQANFAVAWRSIDAFARRQFTPVHTVGDETIWQAAAGERP